MGVLFDRGMGSELGLWTGESRAWSFCFSSHTHFTKGLVLFILYNTQKLLTTMNYYYVRSNSGSWVPMLPTGLFGVFDQFVTLVAAVVDHLWALTDLINPGMASR